MVRRGEDVRRYYRRRSPHLGDRGAGYRWNIEEGTLAFLRFYSGDPSLEAMERVESLLAEGDIAEAMRELNEMFYPHNYYSSDEMTARLLVSINRTALEQHSGCSVGHR
ncbi:MAG: hypothetical protein ABFR50_06795 [Candidatus Fermentibacteria bacterium]